MVLLITSSRVDPYSSSTLPVTEEPAKSPAGVTKIFGKGLVHFPVNSRMLVESYHVLKLSSNILYVRLLQKNFEVLFQSLFMVIRHVTS